MRVIAGELGGRRIHSHERSGLRPTTDRVRESMFAMIASRLDFDAIAVLDLYAGTGALGIEAISRGARTCRFVESDRRATELIKKNLVELGVEARASVSARDALRWLVETDERYDLVLADPPYAAPVFGRLLELASGVLTREGMLVLEHPSHLLMDRPERLRRVAGRTFGESAVSLFASNVENEPRGI